MADTKTLVALDGRGVCATTQFHQQKMGRSRRAWVHASSIATLILVRQFNLDFQHIKVAVAFKIDFDVIKVDLDVF